MNKTIETIGRTANGRKFKHCVTWEGGKVICQLVEYIATESVGSISMYFRHDTTTAEAWRYLTTGKSGRKLLAT